ncbi:MAG: zf-HC2 domain-containing protein [Myxococcales bacterium]|nr:zf-HC2 domain-containing protein [Myxococcales bacterium]
MLTCRQLTELVTDHLEGTMSLGNRLRFQMHLGMCKHCRAYLRQMKMTIETLGHLPTEPMPEGIRTELLQRFKGWNRDSSS